jgi:hypothetical protein
MGGFLRADLRKINPSRAMLRSMNRSKTRIATWHVSKRKARAQK